MSNFNIVQRFERFIYLSSILILLGVLGYMYYTQKNSDTNNELLNQETRLLQQELKKIDREIKQKEVELDRIVNSKDLQLKKKQQQLEKELRKLKEQRVVIAKHLVSIGALENEKSVSTERIIILNKQLVVARNNLQNFQKQLPAVVKQKVDSVKKVDSLALAKLQYRNVELQHKLTTEEQQQTLLHKKVEELEKSYNMLLSPPLRIEVLTDASKIRYSKFTRHINLNFTILPNPIKNRENKQIRIYHLVYQYKDKTTEVERKLIATIFYRKEKRLVKSIQYNNGQAFEKGTHVFEAEVGGVVLASKTIDVE